MGNGQNTSYTLIHRARDLGDEEAWERLVEHYRRFIYFILHKLNVADSDVDDLCQQVLMKLLNDLAEFDREKGRFRPWLSAKIRDAAFGHFRRVGSYQRRLDGLRAETELQVQPAEVDAIIEKEWATYITRQAMDRVRAVFQGQAIHVFELGMTGLSAREIAEKTGLTVSSVYTLRKRVKNRLYLEVLDLTADLES
ncbi:RNA polymerase sigma factor [Pontiella agarivorans]|uniref:Sigma-70 family RNA polymerase sigma factor n=1 Tax=Pontiella agarivorans TaxID=3038953 RepID=A0ABU5MUC8_9BACT|nr:sigma-70 family RNA polymerase sigma factor [Pontiella agarivorans]MDZ8117824.1 sigma-70 family RNA polymerase sigma factor [Pontiella agarivorans]